MSPVLGIVIFAVLFAVVMVAISLGSKFLEQQERERVKGMLEVAAGEEGGEQGSILREPNESQHTEDLLKEFRITAKLQTYVQQSGTGWSAAGVLFAVFAAATVGGVVGWVLRPLGIAWVSSLLLAFLLGLIPILLVNFKRSKRLAEFEAQLPEALEFLARSMRAGHAFSISLEMLGEETPDPLGQEVRRLFNEHNLGAPLEVAMENFAERVPLLDVRLFVSSVLLQRQTGGNLSEILIRLAEVIRERFRLRGHVRAASAHGRLTAAILSILPIVLFVALLFVAPGYLQSMANDELGQWLIIGAIIAQFLAYYFMRRIVNIKV